MTGDTSQSIEEDGGTTIHVASACQAIFRIVDHSETRQSRDGMSLFHVPSFPSLDGIDPSEKLYKKREALDADIVELLLCIDWKINLLIKILSPIQDDALYPYRAVITQLSMKEITISSPHAMEIGTPIELHFVLPILPFKEIFLKGEVVSSDNGAYILAITTGDLKESEREHLIRYLVIRQFQLQREHPAKG